MSPGTEDPRTRYALWLEHAREELVADIRAGRGGHLAVSRYARRIDELIRDLVLPAQGSVTTPFVVCALGGYGRRALCLHSDIDLLIVFDGQIGPAEERLVKAVLHPLWDLKFTVGHQIHELTDFEDQNINEPELLLGLLDARLLVGDAKVFRALRRYLPRAGRAAARDLLSGLQTLNEARHAQYNGTFYQLEPDVKEAPGGLRDVAAVQWIRMLVAEGRTSHGRYDESRLRAAEDFLLRIRSVLHLDSGRNTNLLTHAQQERVADLLGFDGARAQHRVEALMSAYFRHARTVARMLEWISAVARGPMVRSAPAPLGDNLALSNDGVQFVDRTLAASNPASWLLVFRTALERGVPVADQTLTWIERHVDRHGPEDFTAAAGQRRLIRDLLRPRPGLYARLSQMHDCGLLDRVFPEFDRIHCRVIRDFYHRYTVDEHTLLTLRNLEALANPEQTSRGRFAGLLQEIHAPDLLALALLYHDVGKWKDADHAIESVRLAQAMFDRLELPPEARRTIEFLIRHHLEMSRLALRRDSEDPAVVRQLAAIVGNEEHLKMLCVMTLVDIDAVGPGTLTPWKEDQLWRLYVDTYNHLTLGYAEDLIDQDPAELLVLRAGRPSDISEDELLRFVAGLPRRYLSLFDYRHVRLARDIKPGDVHSFLERKDGIWELTVVTVDQPGLFSNLCGLLSYYGMDILRGQAMTSPEGLVVDVFQFDDQEGFLQHNADAPAAISRRLEDVVAGTADVTALLGGKERSLIYQRPRRTAPVVRFDAEHSHKHTVLEIVADDSLGLLHRISRVISSYDCDVDLVLISTEGRTAIDVFHVTRHGAKLSRTDEVELKRGLERMLEPGREAD